MREKERGKERKKERGKEREIEKERGRDNLERFQEIEKK